MVAIFCKRPWLLHQSIVLSIQMPGVIHPTGQLFMAVHLIGYGSVLILHSVFSLSLNPWEAPGWQVIAIDADVKQVTTSWLQTLDNSVFTLGTVPLWGKCRDGGGDYIEVWCVPSASHVPCIDQSHNILTCICYLIFWKFFVYTLQSEQVSS